MQTIAAIIAASHIASDEAAVAAELERRGLTAADIAEEDCGLICAAAEAA